MAKFTINEHEYASAKMDVKKQLHVMRRLAPLLTGVIAIALDERKKATAAGLTPDEAGITVEKYMGPAMQALSGMSDTDFDFVMDNCLNVVQRQMGNGWGNIRVNGQIMFDDIDAFEMLQITVQVMKESLGRFFPNPATNESISSQVAEAP